MRILMLSWVILQSLCWGYQYNELLLDAQSRIYPKITFLQENIQNNDDPIIFVILYVPEDKITADRIVMNIEKYYDHRFDGHSFSVRAIRYKDLNDKTKVTALYLLKADSELLKQAAEFGIRHKIPVFVYDFKDLKFGALFALSIQRSTVIDLNRAILKRSGIKFVSSLYNIVRFTNVTSD